MPGKQEVEANLADLGIGIVSEKLPTLINAYLGFELVTANDEKTRAAGLLGFKVGSELLYIPVLFLNGKVKGTEVLYLANSDVFTSASKQWVEYLTSRNPGVVGKGEEAPRGLSHPSPAQLQIFRNLPQGKYGAFREEGFIKSAFLEGAADEFFAKIAADTEVINLEKRAEFNFPTVLKAMGKVAYANFMGQIAERPELLAKVAQYYDLKDLEFDFPETAPAAVTPPEPKLAILTVDDVLSGNTKGANLTVEQREEALTHGFVVFDKRAEKEKTITLKEDYTTRFAAPKESGFYEIVNRAGQVEKVLVATSAFLVESHGIAFPKPIIVDVESGIFYLPGPNEDVVARHQLQVEEAQWKEGVGKMPSISSATPGKSYMLVSPTFQMSAPFTVNNKSKEEGALTLNASTPWDIRYRCSGSDDRIDMPDDVILRVVDREDVSTIHRVGSIVYVPKTWKILEVDPSASYSVGGVSVSCGSSCESDSDYEKERKKKQKVYGRITPGNQGTITAAIVNKDLFKLTLDKQGSYGVLRCNGCTYEPMRKAGTVKAMITMLGMKVADAIETWDAMIADQKVARWLQIPQPTALDKVLKIANFSPLGMPAAGAIAGGLAGAATANDEDDSRIGRGLVGAGLGAAAGLGVQSWNAGKGSLDAAANHFGSTVQNGAAAGVDKLKEFSLKVKNFVSSFGKKAINRERIYESEPFPADSTDRGYNDIGFREQEGQEETQRIHMEDLSDPSHDWRNLDEANWDRIQQKDVDFLMRAANSGSGNVFDSAMIGVLLRTNRASAQVSDWMPDLVNGLDTKCRLVLLFYWHNQDFAEDYGEDEMAEFEDVLLNSIKVDGQLVLFLKQRSGESSSTKIDALSAD